MLTRTAARTCIRLATRTTVTRLTCRATFTHCPTRSIVNMAAPASSSNNNAVTSEEELNSIPSPTSLQHCAYYAASVDFDRLDGEIVHHAVRSLADSIACALAAVTNPEIARIRQFASKHSDSERSSPIWGTNQTCAPAYAALVNSAMIRCLDANDLYLPRPPVSALSGGHCSDALGGVFAMIDPKVNTGQQVLSATIITYEIQAALASCMPWLERGLHSVSQINFAVPAAAAAFPQYNLTPTQIWNAMSLSASTGLCAQTWLKQGFKKPADGKTTAAAAVAASTSTAAVKAQSNDAVPSIKFVSVGLASQRGVDSIELAKLGMTANSDALETMLRFFAQPEQELILGAFPKLGKEGASEMHRHLIKQFAAQFNLQAVIASALDLYAQGVRVSDVESIEVLGHRFSCADVQGAPEAFAPQSQGSADHSTPYVIWVALEKGTFTPASAYGEPAWLRDDVRAVLSKMKLHVVDEFEKARVEQGKLGCRITAKLKDGRVFVGSRIATSGHPDLPLTDEELLSKMSALLTPLYGSEMASKIWQVCHALVDSKDSKAVQELFQLLVTLPNPARSNL